MTALGRIAGSAGWILAGQVANVGLQALYFVVLARMLGPSDYGLFIAITALTSAAAPFALWGTPQVLMRRLVDPKADAAREIGAALGTTTLAGAVTLAVLVPCALLLLPGRAPVAFVLTIAGAECFFARWSELSEKALVGIGRPRSASQVVAVTTGAKLVGASALLFLAGGASPTQWGSTYLVAGTVSAGWSLGLISRAVGFPTPGVLRIRGATSEGFLAALGSSSQALYNDLDKLLLARLAGSDVTGLYGAAYRLVSVSFVPVRAVLLAAYARFFERGALGFRENLRFAKSLAPSVLGLGVAAAVALAFGAPLLPAVLGHEYADTVVILRWLAPLLLLKPIQYLAADMLTAGSRQDLRTYAQMAAAIVNAALSYWLIRLWEWKGAAVASIASDAGLALALALGIVLLVRREARAQHRAG